MESPRLVSWRRVSVGAVALIPGFWGLWLGEDGEPRRVPATHLERDDREWWLVRCPCGETHEVDLARVAIFECRRAFLGLVDGVVLHRFPEDAPLTYEEAWA